MLVFSTNFPLSENVTIQNFVNLAIEWVLSPNSNYCFEPFSWDGSNSFYKKDKTNHVEFNIQHISSKNIVAVRLKNVEPNIEWISDFVLNNNILSVQLQRNSTDNLEYIPNFHIPYLLKMIFEKEWTGNDNNILVTNQPHFITSENSNIITDIINETSKYKLPIVFVSQKPNGDYFVNINFLSKKLAGSAHILAENDITVSKLIQEKTNGKNPYLGAIQIYFPSTYTKRFLPNIYDSQITPNNIIKLIHNRKCQMKIDDNFQYYNILQEILQQKREESELKIKEKSDDVNVIMELYSDLQQQYNVLKDERDQLKSELNDLNAKNLMLSDRIEQMSDGDKKPLLYYGKEKEFYNGEQIDIILNILNDVYNNYTKSEKDHLRRMDIAKSVLNANSPVGERNKRIKDISGTLKNNKISEKTFSSLKKSGLYVAEDNTHYKIRLGNDSRYLVTLSKTTSDKGRSGKNALSEIKKNFF